MNKILTAITAVITIFILVQMSFAAQISVVPAHQTVSKGENFTIDIYVGPEGSEVFGAQYELHFDNSLLNASLQTKGPLFGNDASVLKNKINNTMGWVKYGETRTKSPGVTNPDALATITFQAISEHGTSELNFTVAKLSDPKVDSIPTNISNGTVELKPKPGVFDTGKPENPYPSISGIHNGIIILNHTIVVNKIFTYPCPGTGGHSEYVAVYNTTTGEEIANGMWKGYAGDWHNITFKEPFELQAGTIYNYTIKTGSYPQIIHATEPEYKATGGKITCDEFIDANGLVHENWIPAIRLWGVVE